MACAGNPVPTARAFFVMQDALGDIKTGKSCFWFDCSSPTGIERHWTVKVVASTQHK